MESTPAFLGKNTPLPASPEEAVLDYVPNPRAGELYMVRFAAPEFTSLCPVTGQPHRQGRHDRGTRDARRTPDA